ncbi:MAG: 3-isopropylmalate dehydrogenase [Candidatus Gastranaerophilales bacterium]|nr:3-isopropylmalate dehydrogenase [Candidatus Gastranaerophilales bacterium]
MNKSILVLKGDGIGPEVIDQALKSLKAVCKKFNHRFEYQEALIGGVAIDKFGVPLPEETLELAKKSDAVFLGAVGDWKYDKLDPAIRPEKGLLGIRKGLGLFANLRPVKIFDELVSSSPLKEDLIEGVDIIIIRELTGGIYFGEPKGEGIKDGERTSFNTMIYKESEVRRIAKVAFEVAMKRNKKVCSIDKANVLDVSRFWREIVTDVAKDYPQVELLHMYVDNAAMQLVLRPKQFDVILTSNLFGDILSDEASVLSGSLGLLPSASLSDGKIGMFEPCHGSAPDFKGLDKLNPIATILSAAMMLKYGLDMPEEAKAIENAVDKVLKQGYRTEDIFKKPNEKLVGTSKMGDLIAEKISKDN